MLTCRFATFCQRGLPRLLIHFATRANKPFSPLSFKPLTSELPAASLAGKLRCLLSPAWSTSATDCGSPSRRLQVTAEESSKHPPKRHVSTMQADPPGDGNFAGGVASHPNVVHVLTDKSRVGSAPTLPSQPNIIWRDEHDSLGSQDDKLKFRVDEFWPQLRCQRLAGVTLVSNRIPSTQSLLSTLFSSVPDGTVCVADTQYGGRGRGSNQWSSPPGCLMFSLTLSHTNGRTLPLLQYVVALAVVQAIEGLCAQRQVTLPQLSLKWPNDIYAASQKVAGVLCTSTYRDKRFNVVVGVGLNLHNSDPTTCINDLLMQQLQEQQQGLMQQQQSLQQHAVHAAGTTFIPTAGDDASISYSSSLTTELPLPTQLNALPSAQPATSLSSHPPITALPSLPSTSASSPNVGLPSTQLIAKEEMLAAFLNQLEKLLDTFSGSGFKDLEPQYLSRWLHSNQRVVLEEHNEEGRRVDVELTIRGLTADGFLLAVDGEGKPYELSPDGNSLDFFKGLVRRKLPVTSPLH